MSFCKDSLAACRVVTKKLTSTKMENNRLISDGGIS